MKRSFIKTKVLVKSDLWKTKLKDDCISQNVFLAIRKDYIDFYYKGGKLFEYNNDFKTHIKYASVINDNRKYLSEKEFSKTKLQTDFIKSYSRIKENCKNYSGLEALGVSKIYHKHSYLSSSNVVVLDIEVSFKSDIKGKTQDRIDILLFNKSTKELKFIEAKHYSNSEIKSSSPKPKVISQISRYESHLMTKSQKTDIIHQYQKYVNIVNDIFKTQLPKPEFLNDKVGLIIFGFDKDQQNGMLKNDILPKLSGLNVLTIGNIGGVNMEKLFKM